MAAFGERAISVLFCRSILVLRLISNKDRECSQRLGSRSALSALLARSILVLCLMSDKDRMTQIAPPRTQPKDLSRRMLLFAPIRSNL